MIIKNLAIRNFRCFDERVLSFDGRVIVVQGPNGSGKSSLLEALHYCCYLRSFRTHSNRDLVKIDQDFFFLTVDIAHEQTPVTDALSIGYSESEGKVVRCNGSVINSYKELVSLFRIVTLSADDVALVQAGPEYRRDFLNYALLLHYPVVSGLFKRYKHILEHRNHLLITHKHVSDDFVVWTHKLWTETRALHEYRQAYLARLEASVNELLTNYFVDSDHQDLRVHFEYLPKNIISSDQDFEHFWLRYNEKYGATEQQFKRSLFGAHLDDFVVTFQNKRARVYASRGQQKLLVLLIKIAQLQQLSELGEPGVLLLDDFMTDFDGLRVERSIAALKDLDFQMFLSCPINPDVFLRGVGKEDISYIVL